MKRSILIFPQFENRALLTQIRERYDPLACLIPPHVTLVFPFVSELSTDEIMRHLQQCLSTARPFSLVLQGITGSAGNYLFLNVKRGLDALIDIHDRLYTGTLKQHLNRDYSYVPHVTVGKLLSNEEFLKALEETKDFNERFEMTVEEIAVEVIGDDQSSRIET
ncbi:MAG: 2-5 ligase superfamily, partial [Bacilli bacterium]|nr:2-5 ligase superfamily [Bacilli bacterium]